jgi:hypothetical protein
LKRKRIVASGGGAEDEEVEERPPRCCCYDWLDEESRIHVLSYLSPADLAEACVVSAQFSRDCFHVSLPAVERAATLALPPGFWWPGSATDALRLRRRLHGMVRRRSSIGRSLQTLRVVRSPPPPQGEGPPSRRRDAEAAATGRRYSFVVPGITGLDLTDVTHGECLAAEALVPHLPDLRHMELRGFGSDTWLTRLPFAGVRERVRSLSFYSGVICGEALSAFRCVTDLSVDRSIIFLDSAVESPTLHLEDAAHPVYLFHACNQPLERVSVKDLTYAWSGRRYMHVPQGALVKFVRRTPTLKWFKSDLTPENVALLRAERPDVTFASWPAWHG